MATPKARANIKDLTILVSGALVYGVYAHYTRGAIADIETDVLAWSSVLGLFAIMFYGRASWRRKIYIGIAISAYLALNAI